MHRSGTSMVARILNLCGLYLGAESDLTPGSPDNRDGHWEHRSFVEVNDHVLETLGGGWDAPPAVNAGWESAGALQIARDRAEQLTRPFRDLAPWGWKDPRNSLTLPFWRSVLGTCQVVVCVRNPLEVWASLQQRSSASKSFSIRLWHDYNERLLASTSARTRTITHYDSYFVDARGEIERVARAVGLRPSREQMDAAVAAAKPALRHEREIDRGRVAKELPQESVALYRRLCAASGPIFKLTRKPGAPSVNGRSVDPEARIAELERLHKVELAELEARIATLKAEVRRQKDAASAAAERRDAREVRLQEKIDQLAAVADALSAEHATQARQREQLCGKAAILAGSIEAVGSALRDVAATPGGIARARDSEPVAGRSGSRRSGRKQSSSGSEQSNG
jgi:hypothetical protein